MKEHYSELGDVMSNDNVHLAPFDAHRVSASSDASEEVRSHTVSVSVLSRDGKVDGHTAIAAPTKPFSNFDLNNSSMHRVNGGTGSVAAPPIRTATTVLGRDTALPLPQSLGLAALYIATSMSYFMSIRYSKANYQYDGACLVLAVELTKLVVSVVLKYREDGEFLPRTVFCGRNRRQVWKSGLPYAIPSFLYAIYNNLTFFNLNLFDPGTYQVFMQTRIVFTGILFTLFLRQALTYRKWAALVILTVGVAAKYFSPSTIQLDISISYMLVQALLSSLAGVYNEYVFKKDPGLSIHQQNFFMYFFALFFNFSIGLVVAPEYYLKMEIGALAHPIFVIIVLLGAATGLSAAFILKFINIIVKAFASAVEVLLTAVVAWMLLGESLSSQAVLAALIVTAAVYVYYTKGWGDGKVVRFGLR